MQVWDHFNVKQDNTEWYNDNFRITFTQFTSIIFNLTNFEALVHLICNSLT